MDNFKTLLFIGKCLTLRGCPGKIQEIEAIIKSGIINWERVVFTGSRHLVLPALLVNLRESDLLHKIPDEIADHLTLIYNLNLQRNTEIIELANRITEALNRENIKPVFLKGVAYLLSDFYADRGERMVGDIDFLVTLPELERSVEVLKKLGYNNNYKINTGNNRYIVHYPRLKNYNEVAAIEVHIRIVHCKYDRFIIYESFFNEKEKLPGRGLAYSLSLKHRILHNIVHEYVHHRVYFWHNVSLRQCYDLFLMAQHTDAQAAVDKIGHFPKNLNNYLAITDYLFDSGLGLHYKKSLSGYLFIKRFRFLIRYHLKWFLDILWVIRFVYLRFCRYVAVFFQLFYRRAVRKEVFTKLGSIEYLKKHLKLYTTVFKADE